MRALVVGLATLTMSVAAFAGEYPVSGAWTYADPDGDGPAATCPTERRMTFLGERRHDTGTSIPDYRNLSLQRGGNGSYRGVDEFFNGQTRGKISYTLKVTDPDHLSIRMDASGTEFKLRRCAP